MKPECHEGPEARKKFEEGMSKLFRASKTAVKVLGKGEIITKGSVAHPQRLD
jgi:hypothetical protein